MNARIEPWGVVVQFKDRPPDEMFSILRSQGFAYVDRAGYWFRPSNKRADVVLACLGRAWARFATADGILSPPDNQNACSGIVGGRP